MSNALNWFEIPVQDLRRASQFYETALGVALKQETFTGRAMAIFPSANETDVGGALIQDERRKPSAEGCLVYLNAAGKLEACLQRVVQAGGRVLLPKTDIGEPGFMALVGDTEGNVVGLHSPR